MPTQIDGVTVLIGQMRDHLIPTAPMQAVSMREYQWRSPTRPFPNVEVDPFYMHRMLLWHAHKLPFIAGFSCSGNGKHSTIGNATQHVFTEVADGRGGCGMIERTVGRVGSVIGGGRRHAGCVAIAKTRAGLCLCR